MYNCCVECIYLVFLQVNVKKGTPALFRLTNTDTQMPLCNKCIRVSEYGKRDNSALIIIASKEL